MKTTPFSASTNIQALTTNGLECLAHKFAIQPAPRRLCTDCRRILVVDDDPTVREAVMAVLAEEGYLVLAAGGGLQALALAASRPVDLVLLDLNLPGQDGWNTFEQLTAEHPRIPIIIATGRPDQYFTAFNAGAGALLEKPFDIPALLQTIVCLLSTPPVERRARLAGRTTEFYYQPAEQKGQFYENQGSHHEMGNARV